MKTTSENVSLTFTTSFGSSDAEVSAKAQPFGEGHLLAIAYTLIASASIVLLIEGVEMVVKRMQKKKPTKQEKYKCYVDAEIERAKNARNK